MKTTITKRSKAGKILGYTGMATALLAMAHDADAQVIYTDVDPDFTFTDDQFEIDFDGDGVIDVMLTQSQYASGTEFSLNAASVGVAPGGEVKAVMNSSYAMVSLLGAGDPIGPGSADFLATSYGVLAVTYTIYGVDQNLGNWVGQSGYVGLKFQAGTGEVHYAWVQLSVASGASAITVLAYGYESTPNVAINAGDMGTTSGVASTDRPFQFSVAPNPATDIAVVDLSGMKGEQVELSVMDAMGKVWMSNAVDPLAGTHALDLASLASGTYFIRMRNGKEVAFQRVAKR